LPVGVVRFFQLIGPVWGQLEGGLAGFPMTDERQPHEVASFGVAQEHARARLGILDLENEIIKRWFCQEHSELARRGLLAGH
jgi:hypothetical protein